MTSSLRPQRSRGGEVTPPTLRPFRFGLQAGRVIDPAAWTELARRAEAEGYASLMIPDHLDRLATFPALMAARQVLAEWRSGRMLMANADALTEYDLLDSPHLAIGTVSQIVEQFEAMRARWGFTYFEVSSTDMAAIAPVVERMAA
jgi:hypothetical protein